jgi:RNA polymerase sigma factor (sigma-70 family)
MQGAIDRDAGSERRATVGIGATDDAFAALTHRHIDSAYRLAWAILQDDGDADDATQDAFALAWRNRRGLRDPERFDAWFGRILVNACRERLRQRARQKVRTLLLDDEPPVGDASGEVSSRDAITRAMRRLDADHRVVVVLRYWADLTIEEIADRLDVPNGTVKSRLHYALRSMRPRLEDLR